MSEEGSINCVYVFQVKSRAWCGTCWVCLPPLWCQASSSALGPTSHRNYSTCRSPLTTLSPPRLVSQSVSQLGSLGFCVLDLHNYLPSFLKQIDSLDGSLLHCTVNMCLWVQFSQIACHQHFGCLLSTYTVFLSVTSSVSIGRKVNLVKETPGKEDCEFGVSPRKKEM